MMETGNALQKITLESMHEQHIYEIGRSVVLWAQLDRELDALLMRLLGHVLTQVRDTRNPNSAQRIHVFLREAVQIHRSRRIPTQFNVDLLNRIDDVICEVDHLRIERKAIPCFCGCVHSDHNELYQLIGLQEKNVLATQRYHDLYRLNQMAQISLQNLKNLLAQIQEQTSHNLHIVN
jgi:hypothetical protein